tara:strand:- start:1023 stop:1220 length:198 start_codon:yes stop_codon:yes gene_type:complete
VADFYCNIRIAGYSTKIFMLCLDRVIITTSLTNGEVLKKSIGALMDGLLVVKFNCVSSRNIEVLG